MPGSCGQAETLSGAGVAWPDRSVLPGLGRLAQGESSNASSNASARRDYVLAPGGAFEGAVTDGWQLRNGAKLASGGRNSLGALSLPPGASAVTPAMCIDLTYPHMRFYFRVMGSAAAAKLGVEVVYPDVRTPMFEEIKQFDGKLGTSAASGWRLSDDVDLKPDLGGQTNVTRRVALRFTSLGNMRGGDARIDDVYIDPRRR